MFLFGLNRILNSFTGFGVVWLVFGWFGWFLAGLAGFVLQNEQKFSNFMSRGGVFDSPFCLRGEGFVHNDCPEGVATFESCPGGMVLDEIDSCITSAWSDEQRSTVTGGRKKLSANKSPVRMCT